jgi:hypothetical protein
MSALVLAAVTETRAGRVLRFIGWGNEKGNGWTFGPVARAAWRNTGGIRGG